MRSDGAATPWRTFALVSGAIVLGALNFAAVFVAFGEIEDTFAANRATVSWALTIYPIVLAAVIVPGGWVADRFGRKTTFLAGIGLFTVGSIGVSSAWSVEVLVLARAVQAAGFGLETPAAVAIVLNAFPPNRRSTAVGAFGGIGGLSIALAPVLCGLLIDEIGWRWTFAGSIPVGVVTFAVGAVLLPADPPGRATASKPDLAGVFGLFVGVAALALTIVQSNEWGLGDPRTVAAAVLAVALLASVIHRSRHHSAPILELSLFRLGTFRTGNVLTVLVASSFAGTYFAFVILLTETWDLTLFRAGLALALIPAIGGPLSVVAGRVADRFGHRSVILPGALCMLGGALWLWSAVSVEPDIVGLWLPAVGLYATGVGLGHAASQGLAMRDVPERHLGIGSAMNRIVMEIGTTVSIAVVIVLLSGVDAAESVAGLRRVLVALAVVSGVGAAISTSVHTSRRTDPTATDLSPISAVAGAD
ncbi:MAG: MFS transporter [Acidimicrobiia bacterium]|nr:MFS transporter [Acidimicrobiia bacterium]